MVTPRQKEVLAFIAAYTAENGTPPSYREMGQHLKITPNAVAGKLRALEAKGCITNRQGQHRSIVLTPEGKAAL